VKLVEDTEESDWLSGDEIEVETVSKNMQHCVQTQTSLSAFINIYVYDALKLTTKLAIGTCTIIDKALIALKCKSRSFS